MKISRVRRRVIAAAGSVGKPSTRFLDAISAPPITIGSLYADKLYADKTLSHCIPDDPVCTADGRNPFATVNTARMG